MKTGIKTRRNKEKSNDKRVGLNPISLIIMLNINSLNSSIKKFRVTVDYKARPYYILPTWHIL